MGFFSFIRRLILILFGTADDLVFLSFSIEDTGKNFSDHLNSALTYAGLRTFRNDDGVRRGENTGSETRKAIQESKISVIVFSKDYASSTQCLDELVMIMDARRATGHIGEIGRVEEWRAALREAADVAGMVLQDSLRSHQFTTRFQDFPFTVFLTSNFSSILLSKMPYEVFLSFRGENTRRSFTDHLYTALCRAEIRTFRDDDGIRRGENIDLEIKKAIQETKLSIIVFSKDYASSRWCLNELAMIMERRRAVGHIVFPVFYDVDPSEVGTQTGRYGEEFANHEIRFKDQMDRVEGWRKALKEVAYMEGMVLEDGGKEFDENERNLATY
ncbi:TMV resistance protein N-like [Populus alba x Populus x berolinensis]|nr:TMV resistance protein N-like [Populus alba x Populus x berolinensis]